MLPCEYRLGLSLSFLVFINHVKAWRKIKITYTPFHTVIKTFYRIYYSNITNILIKGLKNVFIVLYYSINLILNINFII